MRPDNDADMDDSIVNVTSGKANAGLGVRL